MTRLAALAVFLPAPAVLSGCAAPAIQQAGAQCEELGLHVRVLDGQLAQERIVLGTATRQHEIKTAGNLHLTDAHPDDTHADQTLHDRQARDLQQMQDRVAVDEAAVAEARARAAVCQR